MSISGRYWRSEGLTKPSERVNFATENETEATGFSIRFQT